MCDQDQEDLKFAHAVGVWTSLSVTLSGVMLLAIFDEVTDKVNDKNAPEMSKPQSSLA